MIVRVITGLLVGCLLSLHGLRKKSLDKSGSVSAFFVGSLSYCASINMGTVLILFYLSSSKLTKWQAEKKKEREADYKEGGQRNWVQVLSNAGFATLVALVYIYACRLEGVDGETTFDLKRRPLTTYLSILYLAHYSCCNGDTWSSEVGIVSRTKPRLITTWREVPHGTNGGVTPLGLQAAAAGGLFIGVVSYIVGLVLVLCSGDSSVTVDGYMRAQWPVILVCLVGGLGGSMIDSILGATLQFSGLDADSKKAVNEPGPGVIHTSGADILSNHQVNWISAMLTAFLSVFVARMLF
eukprot:GFYU01011023.1.p1 GENE.GFYU01011023.1~~GFYU01011023.1.p1  ORF type:complete len:296 (-),score=68.27 GFYU01011023.1:175-1062(-)